MALGKKRTAKPKRSRRTGMPHSAYCMMVRSTYDLWPKRKKKSW